MSDDASEWELKPDGGPRLAVLMAYDLMAGEGAAVAARLTYAITPEQLREEEPPVHVQLVMTAAAAAELARDLTNAALDAQAATGSA